MNTAPIILLRGDCLELLKGIPDSSVDCIVTDPPYSVLNKSNPHAVWDRPFDMDAWWREIWRVCKHLCRAGTDKERRVRYDSICSCRILMEWLMLFC